MITNSAEFDYKINIRVLKENLNAHSIMIMPERDTYNSYPDEITFVVTENDITMYNVHKQDWFKVISRYGVFDLNKFNKLQKSVFVCTGIASRKRWALVHSNGMFYVRGEVWCL